MSNLSGLSGLKAAVTGGASGIGLATSRMLAEHGATVAVMDLDPSGTPEPLIAIQADLGDDASVRVAVEVAAGRLGSAPSASRARELCRHRTQPMMASSMTRMIAAVRTIGPIADGTTCGSM